MHWLGDFALELDDDFVFAGRKTVVCERQNILIAMLICRWLAVDCRVEDG